MQRLGIILEGIFFTSLSRKIACECPGDAKQVLKSKNAGTLNGQRIDISVTDAGVMVDGASVFASSPSSVPPVSDSSSR